MSSFYGRVGPGVVPVDGSTVAVTRSFCPSTTESSAGRPQENAQAEDQEHAKGACEQIHWKGLITQCCGGALSGLLILLRTLSYTILIYTGPLVAFQQDALCGMLLSSAIAQAIYAFRGQQVHGQIAGSSSSFAPVLAAFLAELAKDFLQPQDAGLLQLTVFIAPLIACWLVSFTMWVIGHQQLATIMQYCPFSVAKGFLAIIGTAMALGGLQMAMRTVDIYSLDNAQWSQLGNGGVGLKLAVCILIVIIFSVAKRKFRSRQWAFPTTVIVVCTTLYIGVLGHFRGVEAARRAGWLFAPPDQVGDFWHFYTRYNVSDGLARPLQAIFKRSLDLFLLVLIAILDMALNLPALPAFALEDGNEDFNPNEEFKLAALSVGVAGTFGVGCSYLTLSPTKINREAGGALGLFSALVCLSILLACFFAGPQLLGYLIPQALGGLLAFAGFDYCVFGIWDCRHLLLRWEWLNIVLMLCLSLLNIIGASYALVIGGGIAALVFVAQYVRATKQSSLFQVWSAQTDSTLNSSDLEAQNIALLPGSNIASLRVASHPDSIISPIHFSLLRSGDLYSPDEQAILSSTTLQLTCLRCRGYMFFGNVSSFVTEFDRCIGVVKNPLKNIGFLGRLSRRPPQQSRRFSRTRSGRVMLEMTNVLQGAARPTPTADALNFGHTAAVETVNTPSAPAKPHDVVSQPHYSLSSNATILLSNSPEGPGGDRGVSSLPRFLILDLTDVVGMDSAAIEVVGTCLEKSLRMGCVVMLVGLDPNFLSKALEEHESLTPSRLTLHIRLASVGAFAISSRRIFLTMSQALRWLEHDVILTRARNSCTLNGTGGCSDMLQQPAVSLPVCVSEDASLVHVVDVAAAHFTRTIPSNTGVSHGGNTTDSRVDPNGAGRKDNADSFDDDQAYQTEDHLMVALRRRTEDRTIEIIKLDSGGTNLPPRGPRAHASVHDARFASGHHSTALAVASSPLLPPERPAMIRRTEVRRPAQSEGDSLAFGGWSMAEGGNNGTSQNSPRTMQHHSSYQWKDTVQLESLHFSSLLRSQRVTMTLAPGQMLNLALASSSAAKAPWLLVHVTSGHLVLHNTLTIRAPAGIHPVAFVGAIFHHSSECAELQNARGQANPSHRAFTANAAHSSPKVGALNVRQPILSGFGTPPAPAVLKNLDKSTAPTVVNLGLGLLLRDGIMDTEHGSGGVTGFMPADDPPVLDARIFLPTDCPTAADTSLQSPSASPIRLNPSPPVQSNMFCPLRNEQDKLSLQSQPSVPRFSHQSTCCVNSARTVRFEEETVSSIKVGAPVMGYHTGTVFVISSSTLARHRLVLVANDDASSGQTTVNILTPGHMDSLQQRHPDVAAALQQASYLQCLHMHMHAAGMTRWSEGSA